MHDVVSVAVLDGADHLLKETAGFAFGHLSVRRCTDNAEPRAQN